MSWAMPSSILFDLFARYQKGAGRFASPNGCPPGAEAETETSAQGGSATSSPILPTLALTENLKGFFDSTPDFALGAACSAKAALMARKLQRKQKIWPEEIAKKRKPPKPRADQKAG